MPSFTNHLMMPGDSGGMPSDLSLLRLGDASASSSVSLIPLKVPLRRLMYLSTAIDPSKYDPESLSSICLEFGDQNKKRNVTGFLLFSAPFFFQVIEGPADEIEKLYQAITKDARHRDCRVLADVPCEERCYEDWDLKEAHLDGILVHPVLRTVLRQISSSFSEMWAFMPSGAADLLVQGTNPSRQCPRQMEVAVAFLHITHYAAMLGRGDLLAHLPDILQAFVDICVKRVTKSGGQVAKFFDGICMAYWPQHRVEDALEGLSQIARDCAELRQRSQNSMLALLHVHAGLHCGYALLCNAGTLKADFTLLGDVVNTCARVAARATELDTAILITDDVHVSLSDVRRADMCNAGSQHLKGVMHPVRCWFMPEFRV